MTLTGKLALLAALSVSLTGCGGLKSALGLEKSAPDEFAIVTKAPLIVPPDFSLRPPKPGAARPQELQPTESARRALLGGDVVAGSDGPSKGEVAFLLNAGADRVDPNIRVELAEDSGHLRQKDKSFTDKILFWRKGDNKEPPPVLIDASAESQRLKRSAESNNNSADDAASQ